VAQRSTRALVWVMVALSAACSRTPDSETLRESFAAQLTANRFVQSVEHAPDELRFAGPGVDGAERAQWRVRIDDVSVEADGSRPGLFKGLVKSSWYADGRKIEPAGGKSNLPIELISNGLAQECWALWDDAGKRWTWE
jgi:hypothetical protein